MTPSKTLTKEARGLSFATGASHNESLRRLERLHATADHYAAAADGPYVLTPEQDRAARAVVKGFETSTRGRLVRPWQSGKTVIAAEVAKRLNAAKTLVVVDRPTRLEDTARVWTRHLPSAEVAIADGSTSRKDMEKTVGSFAEAKCQAVLFTTYRMLDRIVTGFAEATGARLGLVCFEDAHLIAGFRSRRRERTLNIPASARLFATARAAAAVGAGDGLSMNVGNFGEVFDHLTYPDAVKEGLVCAYGTSAIHYEETELVTTLTGLSSHGAEIAEAEARELAALAIALVKTVREKNLHRVVTFHRRIAESRAFTEAITLALEHLPREVRPRELEVQSLDFHASSEKRAQRLDWFKTPGPGVRVLTNPHLVAHSEACASADAILFADPKSAGAAGIDALSRSLRPSRGKTKTQVLLPVRRLPGESDREALKRHENLASKSIYALLNGIDPDGIGHSKTLVPKLVPTKPPVSRAQQTIAVEFAADEIAEIESQVHVSDLPAPKPSSGESANSTLDGVSQVDAPNVASDPARDPASKRMPLQISAASPVPGLEEWEHGEIPEIDKRRLMRTHRWPDVNRELAAVRRELMATDPVPASQRMLTRLLGEEKPATTNSYMLRPRKLNEEHLRAVIETVSLVPDPDAYEDAVRARVDGATAALRKCAFAEHPELAVEVFIGVFAGSVATVDLRFARRPRRFLSDAACRATGRYFASVVRGGGDVARDGAITMPKDLSSRPKRSPRNAAGRTKRRRGEQ